MTTKKVLILGCAGLGIAGLLGAGAVGFFFYHVSQDVEGLSVSVNGPEEVSQGQAFDLVVVVKNERPKKALRLSDIDLAEEYLSGFTVSSVEPAYKASAHVPLDNKQSFTFDVSIPPGASRSFTFKLKARKAGLFRGDVDVCEGLQFKTEMLQTHVKE
jgi:hypothetical protein